MAGLELLGETVAALWLAVEEFAGSRTSSGGTETSVDVSGNAGLQESAPPEDQRQQMTLDSAPLSSNRKPLLKCHITMPRKEPSKGTGVPVMWDFYPLNHSAATSFRGRTVWTLGPQPVEEALKHNQFRLRCCRQCIRHRGMTGRVDLVRRGRPGRDAAARPGAPGAARPRCCRQCIRDCGMTGRVDLVRRGRPGRDIAVSASEIVVSRCCRQCIRHRGMTGRVDLVRRGRPGRDAAAGLTWCAGGGQDDMLLSVHQRLCKARWGSLGFKNTERSLVKQSRVNTDTQVTDGVRGPGVGEFLIFITRFEPRIFSGPRVWSGRSFMELLELLSGHLMWDFYPLNHSAATSFRGRTVWTLGPQPVEEALKHNQFRLRCCRQCIRHRGMTGRRLVRRGRPGRDAAAGPTWCAGGGGRDVPSVHPTSWYDRQATWCAGGGQAEMLPSVHPTSWYDRQVRPGAPGAARPRCCRQCIRHRGMTGRPDLVRRGRPGRDAAVSASDIVVEMLPSVHPTSWYDRQGRPGAPGAARPRCCRQCIRHRGMTGRIDLVRRGRPG
ncbi:hypothetical protein J6590_017384 [Homalodisca vitripennis]|nr:hypothetical protein J6590_017384 [Homalodisca vitripennis]